MHARTLIKAILRIKRHNIHNLRATPPLRNPKFTGRCENFFHLFLLNVAIWLLKRRLFGSSPTSGTKGTKGASNPLRPQVPS
jgi:hypothetical protein